MIIQSYMYHHVSFLHLPLTRASGIPNPLTSALYTCPSWGGLVDVNIPSEGKQPQQPLDDPRLGTFGQPFIWLRVKNL